MSHRARDFTRSINYAEKIIARERNWECHKEKHAYKRTLRRLMAPGSFFFFAGRSSDFIPLTRVLRPRCCCSTFATERERKPGDSGQVYRFARIDNDSVVRDSIIARRCNELATRLPSAYRVRLNVPGSLYDWYFTRKINEWTKWRRIFFLEREKLRSSLKVEATDPCRKISITKKRY